MKQSLLAGILLLTTFALATAQQPFDFQTATPESMNVDSAILKEHADELFRRGTRAYLVVYDDKVIYERYQHDQWWRGDRYTPHGTASAAKGTIGGVALMLAMHDGLIKLDDFAYKYIPQWKDDPVKSKITIHQLGAHTSGIDDSTERGVSNNMEASGWRGEFWRHDRNPFLISRDEVPVMFTPGTQSRYSNPGIGMMNYAVTAAIKDTPYPDIRTYLWERLLKKMGIPQAEWNVGYGKTFELDGLKLVGTWGGGSISPRAMAAVGRLLLNRGNWNGEQLIDAQVVEEVLRRRPGIPSNGSGGFWLNPDNNGNKTWQDFPWDTAMASGAKNQVLIFSPTRKLIVVRFGGDDIAPGRGGNAHAYNTYLGAPLAQALGDLAPYPKSEKITGIQWAPADTITRVAFDSDNWPMTWAKDDYLYTAYGDGYGFDPHVPNKLGMGFGRVSGMPDNFSGENIRSDAENQNSGARGRKASGLLALDDTIYLWVRNDNQGVGSCLGRSADGQKTWKWCDWRFAEFGHVAFVNYGKNYQGARDNFVYMVSHDNPSAYEVSDHFILMRAPKDKLIERNAYEFYKGLDANGNPLWTADVRERQPVFTNAQQCRRSSISYNAGLGRYLWWQQISSGGTGTDTRFIGGLGLFEAPEPWGPWKTVDYTDKWDVGPGDLGCFPTKWMNADGKTLYLVFSGDDYFSLRKVILTVSDE